MCAGFRILTLILTLAVPVLSSLPTKAADLAPHRAVYRMSLETASPTSNIAGIEGVMRYKFAESCDAWTSENSVYLKLLYSAGNQMESTWSFLSWESKNGLKYRFRYRGQVRQSRHRTQVEYLQGTVTRERIGGAASAEFSSPQGMVINLPEGTMFPTRHLQTLIRKAEAGTLTYLRTVFDGTSLDNPYNINALITPALDPVSPTGASGDKIFRHVRMAFFPLASRNEHPEFELGIDYRRNGIAQRIVQDFGEFTLKLMPDKIEILDRPDC